MSCLSIFQATLSIRESAALAVNLRGASRLPAPPQWAVVCTAARSPSLLPAGRDARPGSGRPCQDGLSWGAQHHSLCRMQVGCGPRQGRASSPQSPCAGATGMVPAQAICPAAQNVAAVVCTRRALRNPHRHRGSGRPLSPSITPQQTPQDRGWTPSHREEPRDRPRSHMGGGGSTGRSAGHGDKPCLGSACSPAPPPVGQEGSWGKMDLPREERAPSRLQRAPWAQRLGSRAALLVRH